MSRLWDGWGRFATFTSGASKGAGTELGQRCDRAVPNRGETETSLSGSKEPVPYNGIHSGPAFLGRSCPLGCSLSAPATGGFSVVSPQCSCMRQAPRKRSGPGPTSWGYYSTIVLILQVGGGKGLMVADAVVPPSPPSNVFGNRGTPPVPPAGAAPPAPRWGIKGVVVVYALLRRRGPAWPAPLSRPLRLACLAPLPNLPPSTRAGTELPPAPCLGGGRRRRLLAWRVGVRFLNWPILGGRDRTAPEGGRGRGGWDRCEARYRAVTARS